MTLRLLWSISGDVQLTEGSLMSVDSIPLKVGSDIVHVSGSGASGGVCCVLGRRDCRRFEAQALAT